MNENLNLVEILKDCPKGTKLYSTIFGDVKFEEINEDRLHPLIVRIGDGHIEYFTTDGKKYYGIYNGDCTLFPSKDQRDWSKFNDGIKAADTEPNLERLWHDASEVPQGPYIVLCDGLDNRQWVVEWFYIDMSYANWQDYVERISVSRWAYISDLLPKGVENDKIPIKDDEKDNTL